MSGATDLVSQGILNWWFGKSSPFVPFDPIYVGLFVGDPDVAGVEVSGTNYARVSTVPADWNQATSADPSVTSNLNVVDFGTIGAGGWGTPDYFGLFDSSSGGVHSISGSITVPKLLSAGLITQYPADALRIALT